MENEKPILAEITEYVKTQILSGELHSDQKISERSLCEQFSVSRTIVREALLALRADGWLYSKSKSGTYVAPVDRNEVLENYKARIPLEPLVLQMAYPNITPDDIREMEESIVKIKADPGLYYIYEIRLHMIYVRRTGNRYIEHFFESMSNTMERLAVLSSRRSGRMAQSLDEWNHIILCIKENDPQSAAAWLSRHLLNSLENFIRNNPE